MLERDTYNNITILGGGSEHGTIVGKTDVQHLVGMTVENL